MDAVLLIDGGFLKRKYKSVKKRIISALEIESIVESVYSDLGLCREKCRTYYYDCPPCDEKENSRVSGNLCDFTKNTQYNVLAKLIDDIKCLDYFSVRTGTLSFEGWKLKDSIINSEGVLQKTTLEDSDFEPVFRQKDVDMKIELDISWVCNEHISNQIILITADSDFAPAIKMARRKGVFIHLYTLGHGVYPALKENVDTLNNKTIQELLTVNN